VYDPPFKEYLYPVMVAPPLSEGAVNARLICVLPAVATRLVGALAVVRGVALALLETAPSPAELTALSRIV
jgi:hypothetical protein